MFDFQPSENPIFLSWKTERMSCKHKFFFIQFSFSIMKNLFFPSLSLTKLFRLCSHNYNLEKYNNQFIPFRQKTCQQSELFSILQNDRKKTFVMPYISTSRRSCNGENDLIVTIDMKVRTDSDIISTSNEKHVKVDGGTNSFFFSFFTTFWWGKHEENHREKEEREKWLV